MKKIWDYFENVNDRVLHFACSFIVEITLAVSFAYTWVPWARFSFNIIVIGGGKELWDYMHPERHDADFADLLADAAGAFAAEIVIALLR